MAKNVVLIGAGGHAKVIADIIEKSGDKIYGFLDDSLKKDDIILGKYRVLGDLNNRFTLSITHPELEFIIAIGNNETRKKIAEKIELKYYTAIHPSAQIGINVKIDEGTVIMANACINSDTEIGKHCIINTGSIIEHDNLLKDYVHISPNSALGGTVTIGKNTHIGIGATIINNISICEDSIIGAGAVVVRNIEEKGTYVGVPAKKMEKE